MFRNLNNGEGLTKWQLVAIILIAMLLVSGIVTFVHRYQSIPRLHERVAELEAEANRMQFAIQVSKAYKYNCSCEVAPVRTNEVRDWVSPVGDLVELPGE